MSATKTNLASSDETNPNWIDLVHQYVASLRFGTVEIIVHDSRVIQIEKTERLRLGKSGAAVLSESPKAEAPSEARNPKQ